MNIFISFTGGLLSMPVSDLFSKHCRVCAVIFIFVLASVINLHAQNFAVRYQANQRGGIVYVSNNSLTCNGCSQANDLPPGGANNGNNNNQTMGYIDIDNDATTFSSSSADLTLPSCSQITFAGLYWGGTADHGKDNKAIKIKFPSSASYTSLTSDIQPYVYLDGTAHEYYQSFKDITSLVNAQSVINGTYTVANVVGGADATARMGGWTLVIVYNNENNPYRNLTVFDGFKGIASNGSAFNMNISGFLTPQVGPVNVELGFVGYEGDRKTTGDFMEFNGERVSDASHDNNNTFNSSITNNGTSVSTRSPLYHNTLGYDASIIFLDNDNFDFLGNNETSATVRLSTDGDGYAIGVITTAIDVINPYFRFNHTYTNISRPGQVPDAGDVLELMYEVTNIGNDDSRLTHIEDELPALLHYVPNSLEIQSGSSWVSVTDAINDDQAEFTLNGQVEKLSFRVGNGATAAVGGKVLIGETYSVRARVKVTEDCLELSCSNGTISNDGKVFYYGVINSTSMNENSSGPVALPGECPHAGLMNITVNVPAACMVPDPDISYTSGCTVEFSSLNLPAGYQVYAATDISFSNPLTEATTSGTYTARRVVVNGCPYEFKINITIDPIVLTYSKTDVNCFGGSTGAIDLAVTGGTAPYTYNWSSGQSTEDITNLVASSYTVTVTDAKGCAATETITVAQPAAALALTYIKTDVNCFGGATGAIDLSVTGGTTPYAYSWSSGQSVEDLPNLAANSYTVTVTDAKGCTATETIGIAQPAAALALTYAKTDVSCFGGSTGAIDLSVTGGTAPYTYNWSSGQSIEDISGLSASTYTITVTDAKGCTTTETITISQPAAALALTYTKTDVNCFSGSTGAIDLSVTGGTAPYTYNWISGQNTEDLTTLAANSYTVTVTDAKGCIATETITITQPAAALALTYTKTDANCFGGATGAIDLSVTGGTAPYTYNWSSGQTAEDISGLSASTYTITVTDAKGCTTTETIAITQPAAALALTYTKTDVNCFGGTTGAIDLSVTGGTAPYAYSWSSGQIVEDLVNLASSSYTVTVTDSKGCTATETITITQPAAALALTYTKTDINCFGGTTGAIDLSVTGGTAPYTYNWSSGQSTEDLTNLAANSYTVTVTDVKGCTATETIAITQPAAALALTYTKTDVDCFGGGTGAIDLAVTGGTAPYTYNWSSGQSTEDLTNLAANSYTVTVTDVKGCTATETITIAQPAAALALTYTRTDVNCFGGTTGAIDLSVTGGTAPYTYNWSSGQSTEDITNLAASSYTVTVTDAKGCAATETITIAQPAAALALTYTRTDVNCFGGSTGAIDLSVTGGTAPYTYNWSSGQSVEDLTNLAASSYTVTVTDAKGCAATETITISQPAAALALTYTKTDVNCFGGSTGAIDLSVTGGTAPYSYIWSGGQIVQDISGLSASTYTITITDAKGCTTTETIAITQPAAALTLTYTKTDVSCFGGSTGAIDLSVTGGTAPYTYNWSSGQSVEDLTNLTANSYTVTVTDSKGCTATETITIAQPAAALALTYTKTDINCFGGTTGAIDLSVTGGTAPYSYIWSGGQIVQDISGLSASTYTITITDAKGCTATETITIAQPAAAVALTYTKTDVNCFGGGTGAIDLSVTGGTAPYTYNWSNSQNTEDLTNLAANSYTVTVTDAKGCTTTETITITQPTAALALTYTKTDVNCFGGATGAIDLSVTGGTAPYAYNWSGGQSTEDLTTLAASSYTVTVTDSKGCTATETITISQPAAALALTYTRTDVNCFGGSTGAIDLSVTGGTAPYTYNWNSGQSTEDLTTLAANSYTVTVTDSKGCTATETITITQPAAALALTYIKTDVNCFGGTTGAIDLSVTGGTAPYTYNWNSGQSTEDLTTLAASSYTVTVTDAKGCTTTEIITISQPAAALALTYTKTDVNCFGGGTGAIDLSVTGGTAPYTYNWSSGQSTEDLTILAANSYTVTVTDAKGCTATETITISQPAAALALTYTKTDVNCFGGTTGEIDLSVTGGTAPYTYNWNSGQSTEDLTTLAANSYTVTVTDAKGCTATETITISQPAAALALIYTKTDVNCFGGGAGAIDLSVTGGTAPYTYNWSNGQSTEDLTTLAANSYTVTVTDAKGCTATETITITQPAAALALTYTKTDVNCFGGTTGAIDLSVTGGTAPYTYNWSNSQNTEDITNLVANTYTMTVTDAKGCTATESITITQPAAALAVTYTKTDVNCFGGGTGAIDLAVTGGTAPYTYNWSSGQSTEDITNLAASSYTVTVTDAKGCIATETIMISQPAVALAAALTVKAASCRNSDDGSIAALITGGTQPYVFEWSNSSAKTNVLNNLAAGRYALKVTDAKGCTLQVSAEVTSGNCAPVAADDEFVTEQDTVIAGTFATNDFDAQNEKLLFTLVSQAKNGEIRFQADGSFIYTPAAGFTGTETIAYKICNESGLCASANAVIKVLPSTTVYLTPDISNVREGRKATITATLIRAFNNDITITIAYSGKTSKERDYLLLDQYQKLVIPKGAVKTTDKITIAALTDDLLEGDEDVVVTIASTSDLRVRIGNKATVIINDIYPPDSDPASPVQSEIPENPDIIPDPLVSPNGDGQGNEFFRIENILSFPDNEVAIFNRWGNEVFRIRGYNESDRTFTGYANKGLGVNMNSPLPDGVYYYLITTNRILSGQPAVRLNKGYFILKR